MIDNIFRALVNASLAFGILFLMWKAIDALFSAIHNIGGC